MWIAIFEKLFLPLYISFICWDSQLPKILSNNISVLLFLELIVTRIKLHFRFSESSDYANRTLKEQREDTGCCPYLLFG